MIHQEQHVLYFFVQQIWFQTEAMQYIYKYLLWHTPLITVYGHAHMERQHHLQYPLQSIVRRATVLTSASQILFIRYRVVCKKIVLIAFIEYTFFKKLLSIEIAVESLCKSKGWLRYLTKNINCNVTLKLLWKQSYLKPDIVIKMHFSTIISDQC